MTVCLLFICVWITVQSALLKASIYQQFSVLDVYIAVLGCDLLV